MYPSHRFFVSFSSEDRKYVREIMAALKGQELDVWDYSDIVESIELGEIIFDRLINEIDLCTHMVVVLSNNSLDPVKGRFCRMEIEHAIRRRLSNNITLLPVIIGNRGELKFDGSNKEFEQSLCYDFKLTPESIVELIVKICQVIGKRYIPPIDAHPKLPFRDFFRKEIAEMDKIAEKDENGKKAHSNKNHTDLMIILGEFNEYYKKEQKGIRRALFLITYFLMSCEYKMVRYNPFYPWIVKAVCETELKMFDEAMKSYEKAKAIHPENQDVIGGIGTLYFETRQYQKAVDCFEQIIRIGTSEEISNARINLIITKQAMEMPISAREEKFLLEVNIETYPDDLKIKIFNAQAVQYRIKKDYPVLEDHCLAIINRNLHDTITIRLLQLSFLNRGMMESAQDVINKAIKEAYHNPRLDKSILETFKIT